MAIIGEVETLLVSSSDFPCGAVLWLKKHSPPGDDDDDDYCEDGDDVDDFPISCGMVVCEGAEGSEWAEEAGGAEGGDMEELSARRGINNLLRTGEKR